MSSDDAGILIDSEGRQLVGFWRHPEDPDTAGWPEPQRFVDPGWDPVERAAVVGYLGSGEDVDDWLGFSWCRFKCGVRDREMGDSDLSDGTYVWPQGYAHYLEKHDVRPPEAFLRHVRARLAAQG